MVGIAGIGDFRVIVAPVGERADDGKGADGIAGGGIAGDKIAVVVHIANDRAVAGQAVGVGEQDVAIGQERGVQGAAGPALVHGEQRGGEGAINDEQAALDDGIAAECAVATQFPTVGVRLDGEGLEIDEVPVVRTVALEDGGVEGVFAGPADDVAPNVGAGLEGDGVIVIVEQDGGAAVAFNVTGIDDVGRTANDLDAYSLP